MKHSRQPKLEVTASPGLNSPARDSMTSPTAHPATQHPTSQSVDVNNQVSLCLLHFRHRMGLQSQLLSHERFDKHLDPAPFGLPISALKRLDESGIHASRSAA